MKNQHVGYLIIGISILMAFIIYSFNNALKDIVKTSCSHGTECAMWGTITLQTNISVGIMVFITFIGLYFVFFNTSENTRTPIQPKKIIKSDYKEIMKEMNENEKLIFEKILNAEGTIFQSELVEKTKFTKVKVTRLLDKLEGKALIERKRRGMTNIIILKH